MAKKVPKSSKPKKGKHAHKAEDANSFLSKHPTWKFNRTDKYHSKWNLHTNCETQILIESLTSFERMTWKEIMIDSKTQHHHVYVEKFIKEARDRLSELHIHEDQLFSLRLNGTSRIYGILQDGIFSILWYDCNHEIYPSIKKHT